ncbi:uncharacterized protein LOC131858992 [Cryptomeria japonica]|uniref:uncharacterized protein LOC131858992 n=1 Tax=Cryptomeria japonica TaxID=3369 RepID=UPI0027DA4C90|nr:uncharacterized protein LOC131858992 [Cryptomeria japonica]
MNTPLHGKSFTEWDNFIRKQWSGIKIPPFTGKTGTDKEEIRKTCKWQPPKHGWFKLNFDGASRGNPGTAGAGCIIHLDKGKSIGSKSIHLGQTTNNTDEFLSLIEGLKMCRELRIHKVEIEGDSALIINAIRNKGMSNWKLKGILDKALELLNYFTDFTINHIYREANLAADALANLGADGITRTTINISDFTDKEQVG